MSNDIEDLIFSLRDREGNEHQYVVSPHIGRAGLQVIDAMISIGLGPLAEGAFAAARASEAQQAVEGENARPSISALLEHVDIEKAIGSIQAGISNSGGMSTLAPLVLQHTMRDGQKLVQAQGKGWNTAVFDLAYTRNWRELREAFQRVMEINGFFDLLGGWLDEGA